MAFSWRFAWVGAAILLIGAAGVLSVAWYACEILTHPKLEASPYRPSDYNLELEKVRFKSLDGLPLTGWFVRGANGATIILAHGMGSDWKKFLPHADYLHNAGYSVFMFDFRYRGEHEGKEFTGGAREYWDIIGAVNYLKTRPDVDMTRIGVLGGSAGAASAIIAAAETAEIKGVIAQIPFTSVGRILNHTFPKLTGLPSFPFAPITRVLCELRFGVDLRETSPIKVVEKISPRPIFFVDEGRDHLFPCDSVEDLYNAARDPKEFWMVPEAEHGRAREARPEEYRRRVLAFWQKVFGNQPEPLEQ
jgi:fermentation-respiration switch protein FrsA (DUF1100 family)